MSIRSRFDGSKFCPSCEQIKPNDKFYRCAKNGTSVYCKECQALRSAEYYKGDGKKNVLRYAKETRRRIKLEVIAAYGGQCVCCGEDNPEFLAVDHKNGGGTKHRATASLNGTRAAGASFYRYLKRLGYPKEYQILCHNCNWAKFATGDCCPHKQPSWMPPALGGFVCTVTGG